MTPEGSVLRACTDLLDAYKLFYIRQNTGAMKGSHKGKSWYVRFGQKGMADLQVILCTPLVLAAGCLPDVDGNVKLQSNIWVEVKGPKGEQTPDQRLFQERVTQYGHLYLVAHSSDDLLNFLKEKGVIR